MNTSKFFYQSPNMVQIMGTLMLGCLIAAIFVKSCAQGPQMAQNRPITDTAAIRTQIQFHLNLARNYQSKASSYGRTWDMMRWRHYSDMALKEAAIVDSLERLILPIAYPFDSAGNKGKWDTLIVLPSRDPGYDSADYRTLAIIDTLPAPTGGGSVNIGWRNVYYDITRKCFVYEAIYYRDTTSSMSPKAEAEQNPKGWVSLSDRVITSSTGVNQWIVRIDPCTMIGRRIFFKPKK